VAGFLQTEVALGHTRCSLARLSRDAALSRRRVRAAQAAIDTVNKFMWKINLEPRELDQLTAQIERLKFELNTVRGESDGRSEVLFVRS